VLRVTARVDTARALWVRC